MSSSPAARSAGNSALVVAFALSLSCVAVAARAQVCELAAPPFAGHALPLSGPGSSDPYALVEAYPALVDAFVHTTDVDHPDDGSGRVFVVQKRGVISVFPDDPAATSASTFLDIQDRVLSDSTERGLLSLVFHPDWANNGRLFVYYAAEAPVCQNTPLCSVVAELQVSAGDPDLAEVSSERIVLEREHVLNWHYGGDMHFGPDGLLYIASGDSTSLGPQDTSTLQGAILRIDVDGALPYEIPPGNPFAGSPTEAQEILHYGVRNPWRFSFDRANGDLWIADVGAQTWEEVNHIPAGSPVGLNLGWNLCEGFHAFPFNGTICTFADYDPVHVYAHDPSAGFSITGGYVYRGSLLPGLVGRYLFADFVTGRVWSMNGPGGPVVQIADTAGKRISTWSQKPDGEVVLGEFSSNPVPLWRLAPSGADPGFPPLLSGTGLFEDVATLTPASGLVEYDVNAELWSDAAEKRRWIALPSGQKAGFHATEAWSFPVGTVFVKHFELPQPGGGQRRVETRVLLHQSAGWLGYTYRWNATETDAELLLDTLSEDFSVDHGAGAELQTWVYPSPNDCLGCHTSGAGSVLGARTRQLNRDFPYAGGTANQIEAWTCAGLFDAAPASALHYGAYPDPTDALEPIQDRTRAYLAANCAQCHRPAVPDLVNLDLRWATPIGAMNLVGEPAAADLGTPGALRIEAGSHATSTLWQRMDSLDPGVRMPKIGSQRVDPVGVTIVADWIDNGLAILDSDLDGVADGADNCIWQPNAGQADTGGVGSATPDGVGDACQCGDLDASGAGDAADLGLLRAALAGSATLTPEAQRRCPGADARGLCTLLDVVRLARPLAGAAPALGQDCRAATEPF